MATVSFKRCPHATVDTIMTEGTGQGLTRGCLAIAARAFDTPSETFIRSHFRNVRPERTVGLCWHGELREADIGSAPIHRLPTPRRGLAARLLPPFPTIAEREAVKFLRTHNVTDILAEFGMTGFRMLRIAEGSGCRLFVHFHGLDASKSLREKNRLRDFRKLFPKSAAIIAPSQFLIDKLIAAGCPPEKTHVIPCGVDADRFTPSKRLPGRAIMVGRLVEKKDPVTSLRAFASVAPHFPEAHLDVIGDGPLLAACQSVVTETGTSRQITMHGVLPHAEVTRLMSEASLFLQHSVTPPDGNTEGMPVALLEAMASGLGIVTTRHAGIPEAITNGVEGLLVDERDEAAMSRAIADLLYDPVRAVVLGGAARQRCLREFIQEVTNEKLRRILYPE